MRIQALSLLGSILARRYEKTNSQAYIDEAIGLQRIVLIHVSALPHEERTNRLHGAHHVLADHLKKRYEVIQDPKDLEDAISNYEMSLALCPPSHKNLELLLARLGQSLGRRFHLQGQLKDLNNALATARRALSIASPKSEARSYTLDVMAGLLVLKFDLASASESELAELVSFRREALRLTPHSHHSYHGRLNNLGEAIRQRFLWTGILADLEEAIQLFREDSSTRNRTLANAFVPSINLAEVLYLRYKETGRIDDLRESIMIYRDFLRTETNPRRRDLFIPAMILCLCVSFENDHRDEDLQEAIALSQQHLETLPVDHQFRFPAIQRLCDALILRGQHHKYVEDIERALDLLESHNKHDFLESASGPAYFRALGASYLARFRLKGERRDVERARDLLLELLERAPFGRRARFQSLIDLAELYLERGSGLCNPDAALGYLKQAVAENHRDVRSRLQGTIRILRIIEANQPHESMSEPSVRKELLDIYSTVTGLLPRVAYFGLDPSSRLESLSMGQSVATVGAVHALVSNQPEKAVEFVEQGRAVFWTHTLRLRSDFQDVPEELRERLTVVARKLEKQSDISYSSSDQRLVEKAISQRRQESDEFNGLVDQIRRLPGLDRFMLCHDFSTLSQVAEKGPVVILVTNAMASYAIIIRGVGRLVSIALPSLTDSWVVSSGERWRSAAEEARSRTRLQVSKVKGRRPAPKNAVDEVLEGLWTKIAWPVLDALQLKPSSGRQRPRIWWCPTGSLVHLPIHAARASAGSCSDYVVSSYIPTLETLINARRTYNPIRRDDVKTLLAAVPRPHSERWKELPATCEEVHGVAGIIPAPALIQLPEDEDALRGLGRGVKGETLLGLLPDAAILHLACHGYQDPDNPLKSGFVMSDETLTIERMMPVPLPRAFLAFLSACGTAKVDNNQPDQVINLAATMLYAGFKSVIATLWSMDDVDGPMIAASVYKTLFGGDSEFLNPDDVPYALDAAVRELEHVHPDPSRWAPYIHLGI
ncbi:hypothetical protein PUNSTDRAFT_134641 [Punctularia strigosozonata HHB-11173 SS5]|uniref:uncharacterized protein n=1 Tax=Punctularia strigosozonata (strain HHB-11173) TaxID=741275 RepID=UPI0004418251|nr:uncharacterized protein PUNSTDRAFT_134641 [Punctularia strigosozonata HHB-11173 SS5]EIN08249.1 hypothetical protein PUNSTDRAFT_134641 [Punctularia strigosozonata HHB-11173 SS5]